VTTKTEPSILPLEGEIDLHVSPQIGASLAALIAKKPATWWSISLKSATSTAPGSRS
jgi:anti-anti-sigma regulatory factor